MKPRSLHRELVVHFIGLALLTVGVFGGVLCVTLTAQLDRAFDQRVEAQKGQAETLLERRIAEVRFRLKEVARNNTVRVGLLLGISTQLREVLSSVGEPTPGLVLLVQPRDGPPLTARPLPEWAEKALASDTPSGLIRVFREAVRRRRERLGTAVAVYNLAEDVPAVLHLESVVGATLCRFSEKGWSPLAYASMPSPAVRIVPLSGFPELAIAVPTDAYRSEVRTLFGLLAGTGIVALFAAWALGLRLARGLSTPLARLAAEARSAAHSEGPGRFEPDLRIAETTELARALQKMIREMEEVQERSRYRELFHSVADPVCLLDPAGRILEVNEALCTQLGLEPERLTGRDVRAFLPPGAAATLIQQTRMRGTARMRSRLLPLDGEPREVDILARAVHYRGHSAVLAVTRDVSDQLRAERDLRASRDFLQWVIDHLPVGLLIVDSELRVRFYNRTFADLWRMADEFLQRSPTVGELVRKAAGTVLRAEEGPGPLAERFLRELSRSAQGIRLHTPRVDGVEMEGFAKRTPDGGYLLTFQDVTERTRRERECALLAAALQQAAEGIALATEEGRLFYVNTAYQRITGYPADQALGRVFWEVPPPLPGTHPDFQSVIASTRRGEPWKARYRVRRKGGKTYEEDCIVSPVRDPSAPRNYLVVVKRDITRETELERQLAHIQKMQAIDTLAGGIAHDFNNILMAMMVQVEIVHGRLPPDSPERSKLERALRAGERARKLVQQLLTLSRKDQIVTSRFRLGPLVEETAKLVEPSLPAAVSITIRIDVPEGGDWILGSPDQIQQVLVNLCTNAAHALEGSGGSIEVGLQRSGEGEGVWLEMWVADDGCGIPPDIVDRVFEPFFTTKGPGKGTGLGLALVRSITERHGGRVEMETEPGRGTRVRVMLPGAPDIPAARDDSEDHSPDRPAANPPETPGEEMEGAAGRQGSNANGGGQLRRPAGRDSPGAGT